jgi:NTP pyrophosphatase (non-canonical NTP hydrolase)
MDLNYYQFHASNTAIYPKEQGLVYTTLGLVGEAGEVAEKVKKFIRGDLVLQGEFETDLAHELGDVLWYLASLASELNISLTEIAELNLSKLASRQKRDVLNGSGDDR